MPRLNFSYSLGQPWKSIMPSGKTFGLLAMYAWGFPRPDGGGLTDVRCQRDDMVLELTDDMHSAIEASNGCGDDVQSPVRFRSARGL